MEDEHALSGGTLTPIVRVGATVRRATGAWTPSVHALLRYLEVQGFDGAPRVLGIDRGGREVLTYIEGEAGYFDHQHVVPPNLWSDAVLVDAARLLHRLHDATENFRSPPDAIWQLVKGDHDRHEVICHNDFAPYNCIFRNGRLQAIIDWDMAGPGPRIWDVAYAAYRFVPLVSDEHCLALGLRHPPERERRLRLFCDTYGLEKRNDLLDVVAQRIEAIAQMFGDKAAEGDPRFQLFVAEGKVRECIADIAWLRSDATELQHNLTIGR